MSVFYSSSFDFEKYILDFYKGTVPFDLDLVVHEWNTLNFIARIMLNQNTRDDHSTVELMALEKKCRLFLDYFTDTKLIKNYSTVEILQLIEST